MQKLLISLAAASLLAGCAGQTGSTGEAGPIGNATRQTVSADAKVVVVEFSDFSCPACQAAQPIAGRIASLPGVHFELRHFPLPIPGHEMSDEAAEAYECAANQGFGKDVAAALFAEQGKFTDDLFLELPTKYGLTTSQAWDDAKYRSCVQDRETKSIVNADLAAVNELGLNSTPSFVINGEVVTGGTAAEKKVQELLAAAPAETPAAVETPAAPATN